MVAIKPVIYQLVVRYFGNVNPTNQSSADLATNGCGKFDDINDAALSSLRAMGMTHIWLTGCIRQATLTNYSQLGLPPDDPDAVKGIAGSFYAIRDYFDVCPDYAVNPIARLVEFRSLVQRIHSHGMKVLLDFVPNHVARGYHSVGGHGPDLGVGDDKTVFFTPSNHYYYLVSPPGQSLALSKPSHWQPAGFTYDGRFAAEDGGPGRPPKATGNNVTSSSPSESDWYETVKLNYGFDFANGTSQFNPRPRTWDSMDAVLSYWQSYGVDGFRCDFAHYIPPEAWSFLLTSARQRDPNAYFIAEAYPYPNSGDPITDHGQLITAGFDAVYHDNSYDSLKLIYQGKADLDSYDREMTGQQASRRAALAEYLENHDERRVASAIIIDGGPDSSGFGSSNAGFQLATLQFLYSSGPVLFLNGQEVGEPGTGIEGYNRDDGRTTLFDYWCMPEHAKWVNRHRYDGANLTGPQKALREYYAALITLCQDPAVRAEGYWGLRYYNNQLRFPDCPSQTYSFARFDRQSSRLLLIAANFLPGSQASGTLRLPVELLNAASLAGDSQVSLILQRGSSVQHHIGTFSASALASSGIPVSIPDQSSCVFLVTGSR